MSHKHANVPPRLSILRRREVQTRTGLSRSTIYRLAAEGCFPQSVRLGERAVGWIESEIQEWLEHQVASTRAIVPIDSHHRTIKARTK